MIEGISPGLFPTDFFHLSGFQQRTQQIHRALSGNREHRPDLGGGEAAVVVQQLQPQFLFGAQHEFLR